jgi:hypothetical protein
MCLDLVSLVTELGLVRGPGSHKHLAPPELTRFATLTCLNVFVFLCILCGKCFPHPVHPVNPV